jgi:hypothetical protein
MKDEGRIISVMESNSSFSKFEAKRGRLGRMVDCEKAARLTFIDVVLLGLELFLEGFLNDVSNSGVDLALELLE